MQVKKKKTKRIVDDTERIACGSKATELQVNPITHKMKNPTQLIVV